MPPNETQQSPSSPTSPSWTPVCRLDEVPVGSQTVIRHQKRRIALFRPSLDALFAVDDQCPHEGYPLSKGKLVSGILTCCWHNYKFELQTGRCVKGDEDVRRYETRVRDGKVEIQLADEATELSIPRYIESLEAALYHRRIGQVARDVVRLIRLGVKAEQLAFLAARYEAQHAEYGAGHTLPVAVDVLAMVDRYPGVSAALPLLQAFELCSESCVRLPKRAAPEAVDPGDSFANAERRLRRLVEEERGDEAQSLLLGALSKPWPRDVIEPWLLGLCTDHFLGFGHALIYTIKSFDLLRVIGWQHADAILPGILLSTINQTREELLPKWRWFRSRLSNLEHRLPELAARQPQCAPAPAYDEILIDTLVSGTKEAAFDSITSALEGGSSLESIVSALSVAASEQLLRFDSSIDANTSVQEGWLDVTHLLTFVNATRYALQRHDAPRALKLLFQAARFINRAQALNGTGIDSRFEAPGNEVSVAIIVEAVRSQQPSDALAATEWYLSQGGDAGELEIALADLALEDRLVRPIVVGHLIKTCRAAFDEFRRLPKGAHKSKPVLALVRFAASPVQERSIARLVHEAIRFVDDGKVPTTLT